MKAFIDQLPRELEEAAAIDGSTMWQTLWHIVLPLSHAGLIATSVFIMVFAWNDFLFAFIFTAVDAKTAPLVISEMVGAVDGVDWGILFAAATLSTGSDTGVCAAGSKVPDRRPRRRHHERLIRHVASLPCRPTPTRACRASTRCRA